MPKLTREQYKKWSSDLKNGFVFDIQRFVIWNEKEAIKDIELEDGNTLRATLMYRDERTEGYKYTGKQIPTLHLQIYKPGNTEGIMVTSGLGCYITADAAQDKKLWKEICKLTELYNSEKLLSLMKENMTALNKETVA